jgi:hypothetical protein
MASRDHAREIDPLIILGLAGTTITIACGCQTNARINTAKHNVCQRASNDGVRGTTWQIAWLEVA